MINRMIDALNIKISRWLWRSSSPSWLNPINILEKIYRLGFNLRSLFLCKKTKPYSIPVWVVGNISVGGEGKTPFVSELIKFLENKGYRPGVVSRGYGRKSKGTLMATNTSPCDELGDEMFMVYRQFSGNVPIAVGNDRHSAITRMIKETSCNIIVSDDGLQQPSFYRNIEIIVMDAQRGIGNGRCLPLGPLRQSPQKLNEVDAVFLRNHKDGFSVSISSYFHANDPDIMVDISQLKGKEVTLVAGVAYPERIVKELEGLGVIVRHHLISDHTTCYPHFSQDRLWLITMKDWSKLMHTVKDKHCLILKTDVRFSESLYDKLEGMLTQNQVESS